MNAAGGDRPLAVALMGPTASGKTALAIDLVRRFNFQIVSADAAQVYRGMNIGTAKPDADELKAAPHRLIDIREPNEAYSVAEYRIDALAQMEEIQAAGDIPLVVGGSMFYFEVLANGLPDLPGANPEIRGRLDAEAAKSGWPALHARLAQVDPVSARRIEREDGQRVARALEVYEITGKTITELSVQARAEQPFEFVKLAIVPSNRGVLHRRIATRFEKMIEQGFVNEVRDLIESGRLQVDSTAYRSVGYRQVGEHVVQGASLEQAMERGIAATRQLAKRQLTWLRHTRGLVWIDGLDLGITDAVSDYLRSKTGHLSDQYSDHYPS